MNTQIQEMNMDEIDEVNGASLIYDLAYATGRWAHGFICYDFLSTNRC